MNDFERKFDSNEELSDIETDIENSNEIEDESEFFDLDDAEYNSAMSGTVSDKNALSIYKPKVKKVRHKGTLLVAVISSVITAVICCSVFTFVVLNMNTTVKNQNVPTGSKLSVSKNNGNNSVTQTVVSDTGMTLMSVPDIYNTVSPAVVSVLCTAQGGYGNAATSSGSGVILTADGYIATNNHVIDGASIITVKTIAGQSFDATVVGKDERTDLAVLKVSAQQELPYAEIGDSSSLRVGDMALAIGNPLREELVSTLTVGYISAIDRTMVIDQRQMTMIQTDAAINPGNSGGALINMYGQVIGITTAKSTGYDVEGLGFAIPMNEAVPVIESIIQNGYVTGRPLVGITGIDITEAISEANDIPRGVYVNSVIEGGAADNAGIKKGDIIIKCDGKEVKSVDDINEIRDDHMVGDKIEFVVSRNGKEIKCIVKLQEEKPSEKIENTPSNDGGKNPYSDFFSYFGW